MMSLCGKIREKTASRPLLLSVMLSACIICALLLFNHPAFETNDDNYLASVVYGVRGSSSVHTVYISSLLSGLLSFLQRAVPFLPWYTLFQCAVLFASFVSAGFVILRRNLPGQKLKAGIFLLVFAQECFVQMQYTKTAAIATIAGILLFSADLLSDEKKPAQVFAGGLLILCGFLLRKESFLLSSAIMVPYLIHLCLQRLPALPRKAVLLRCVPCAVLAAACAASFLADRANYASPEWQNYLEFNSLRTELTDYGFPDYTENIRKYRELEITQDDYYLYQSWDYADPEQFTVEKMQRLIDAREKTELSGSAVHAFLNGMLSSVKSSGVLPGLLLLFCLWIFGIKKKAHLWVPCLTTCLIVLFQLYLFLKGRAFLNRVDFSFYCLLALLLILYSDRPRFAEDLKHSGAVLLAVTVLFLGAGLPVQTKDVYPYDKKESQDFYSLLRKDQENLYVIENVTQDTLWTSAFRLFDVPGQGILSNSFILGGWLYPSPVSLPSGETPDSLNPFTKLIDNPSAYLVADYNTELILQHIRSHYNPYVYAYAAKNINGHLIWRVVTHPPRISFSEPVEDGASDLCSDLSVSSSSGYCFVEGSIRLAEADTYAQQVFIEVRDNSSRLSRWYYTTQYSYREDSGEYSHDYIKVLLDDVSFGDLYKYTVSAYLISEGRTCRVTLVPGS